MSKIETELPDCKSGARGPAAALTAFFGMAVSTFVLYPGELTPDSLTQYRQLDSGDLTDWYPPLFTFLWSGLDKILPGYGGVFLLHAALFWFGLASFCFYRFRRPGAAALATFLIGLSPLIFPIFSQVSNDAGMLAGLVFCLGMLYRSSRSESAASWLFGVFGAFYAISARHNAFAAALILTGWASLIFIRDLRRQRFPGGRRFAGNVCVVWLVLSGFLVLLRAGIEDGLIKARHEHFPQAVMLHDIVAISYLDSKNYMPDVYSLNGHRWYLPKLKKFFDPADCSPLVLGNGGPGKLTSDRDYRILTETWLATIFRHPLLYLSHRWEVFQARMIMRPENYLSNRHVSSVAGDRWTAVRDAAKKVIFERMIPQEGSLWFAPLPYLVLCFAAVAAVYRRRPAGSEIYRVVLVSALSSEAFLFFAATAPEARYSFWLVFSAVLVTHLFILGRFNHFEPMGQERP